jgi:hypothetical protein
MDVNDDAHSLKKRSALENIASKLAPTKKRPRLFLRIKVIQNTVHRQLRKGNHLLDSQRQVAFRAIEDNRQLTGHDAGRCKGCTGVNQKGFVVDVGGNGEDGVGAVIAG